MAVKARLARPLQASQVQFTRGGQRVYVYADTDPRNRRNRIRHSSEPNQVARTSSSSASALSSLVFSARASSLTRICLAFASIRFSPAERPRSLSRRQRSRTTSATLFTSPEASFSRLALYRRDQLVGSSVYGARSTSKT